MRMVRMLQRQRPGSPGVVVRDFLWHKERRLLALQVPSHHMRDRGLPVIFPALLTMCSGQQGTEISSSKTKQWGSSQTLSQVPSVNVKQ